MYQYLILYYLIFSPVLHPGRYVQRPSTRPTAGPSQSSKTSMYQYVILYSFLFSPVLHSGRHVRGPRACPKAGSKAGGQQRAYAAVPRGGRQRRPPPRPLRMDRREHQPARAADGQVPVSLLLLLSPWNKIVKKSHRIFSQFYSIFFRRVVVMSSLH